MSHPFAISSHLDVLVRVAGDEICFFPACCKLLLIFFSSPSFLAEPDGIADPGKVAATTTVLGGQGGKSADRLNPHTEL